MSFRNKGNVQNIQKEDKPLSLSMPVITEEENESLRNRVHCIQEEEKTLNKEPGVVFNFEFSDRRKE